MLSCAAPAPACCWAALKLAVHPSRNRREVLHIIAELHRRLQDATDWLVGGQGRWLADWA